MKKLIRLFLLAILWLCFLWVTFAQNWTSDYGYDPYVAKPQICQGDSFWAAFSRFFLILILFIIIPLSIRTTSLWKKLRNTPKWTRLFYIPILNLYPLCKITLGRIWFYCLVLFVWFFVYLIYKNRNWCYSHYLQKLLIPIFIVWILSICVLLVLSIKSIIYSKKLNKESSLEQNIN